MARTRTGSGILALLVVFIILFFFGVGAAILFFTQKNTALGEKRTAEQNAQTARDDRATMDKDLTQLKAKITGVTGGGLESVMGPLDNLNIPQDENVLGYIEILRTQLSRAQSEMEDIKRQLAQETQRAQEAQSKGEAASSAFEKASAELTGQITDIQGRQSRYETQSGTQLQELQKQFEDVRKQSDQRVTDLSTQSTQKDNEITTLKSKVDELTNLLRGPGYGPDPSLLADGHIVSVVGEERLVYIDRGRTDRIIPGMTFEVFARNPGVIKDEAGLARGKATIEVVNVSDSSSVARVVRAEQGKAIVEGDVIANAIYDPNMRFKFLIFGEFDIDQTGQATESDQRRIRTMITEWGGLLTDELNYDTDFVVLGQPPQVPAAPPKGTSDPVTLERYAQAEKKFRTYSELESQAKKLSIPVLNQNRFLTLVGYYQR